MLEVWVLVPTDEVKAAAAEVQRAFAHIEWIEPAPAHFLHVTICHEDAGGPARVEPFRVAYRRVNCFHEAVVVEVEGDALAPLARRAGDPFFLPHLTLGYVRDPGPPGPLRSALAPLRDTELGEQWVDEVLLCRFPAARETILRPWTILERLPLGGRADTRQATR